MTREEILKQPFSVKYIDITGFVCPKDKSPNENEDFHDFIKRIESEHLPNVLFNCFRVNMESCDCSEYGCSHPPYPTSIRMKSSINKIFEVEFDDDYGFVMTHVCQSVILNDPSTTMQDFIDALNLLKVPYEFAV